MADSAAVLRAARDAQATFERRRRALLPVVHGDAGRCDVRIGRYCYWYDERDPLVPPEPAAIGLARERLLGVLGDAAARLPGDIWLAGQRVRYLLEAGRGVDAIDAAHACQSEIAWCNAILGLALHARHDAAGAERAFDAALQIMPAADACRWVDPRLLVPDAARRHLGPSCPANDSLARRFWWLATPFLSRGGNDRRNEHLARRVLAELFAESRTPYADRWRDDLDELLLRYGWPDRWSRRAPPLHVAEPPSAVGYEPSPAYRFTPNPEQLAAPLDPAAASRSIRDPSAHERYAPGFARHVVELDLTVAAFRRGDSLRVVAATALPRDSLAPAPGTPVVLAVAAEHEIPIVAPDTLRAPITVLGAMAPMKPALVGVESLGDSLRAARGRSATRPPYLERGFGVSDLLVYDADRAAATDVPELDDVASAALPAALPAPRAIGVYWELYGLPPGHHAIETTLRVEGEEPGWLKRTWAAIRGSTPQTSPHLRWTDVGPGGAFAPRTMLLELSRLPPGRYVVTLHARHPDGRKASARRAIVFGDR